MKHAISAALSAVLLAGAAGAQPIPIDDFAKEPSITSLSMSPEGDFIVGLVSKPGSDNEELALAVWDIDGEIDTTKVLLPNRITPGNKRARFFQADAIGQGRLLVRSKQAWTGQTYCLEGGGEGAVKTFIFKTYFGDKNIDPKKLTEQFAGLVDEKNECAKLGAGVQISSRLPLEKRRPSARCSAPAHPGPPRERACPIRSCAGQLHSRGALLIIFELDVIFTE